MFAGSDEKCSVNASDSNLNQLQFESIPAFAADELAIGEGGMNWIGANDAAFMALVE